MHVYAAAIDIHPDFSNYWRWASKEVKEIKWKNRIPLKIIRIFEKYGHLERLLVALRHNAFRVSSRIAKNYSTFEEVSEYAVIEVKGASDHNLSRERASNIYRGIADAMYQAIRLGGYSLYRFALEVGHWLVPLRRVVPRSPTLIEARHGSSSTVLAAIADYYQRDACNQLRCRSCMGRNIKCVLSELSCRAGRRARSPAGVGLSKEDQAVVSLMVLIGSVIVARNGARRDSASRDVDRTVRIIPGWLLLHWT
jgi:hypothetical protein